VPIDVQFQFRVRNAVADAEHQGQFIDPSQKELGVVERARRAAGHIDVDWRCMRIDARDHGVGMTGAAGAQGQVARSSTAGHQKAVGGPAFRGVSWVPPGRSVILIF
jgi:hypothetical protein